eukprot:TRINITY_DN6311_c0_g1_i2.p1 TRINITY_DN6311_c0_g1~~TRINITY_DN6311_c0_g1_i2.p1  ORF type:complete len:399 (+),score=92.23 TRINITY_DN6311_c0_g1_i2:29-1225(+)
MSDTDTLSPLILQFKQHYGSDPTIITYAPGRVEILGNHTDYNHGYVLSAAIDKGIFFLLSYTPADQPIRIFSQHFNTEVSLSKDAIQKQTENKWVNYILGVLVQMLDLKSADRSQCLSFNALFGGNLPLGAGLSSSAALEVSSAMAFNELYGLNIPSQDLAKICQKSEHTYVGAMCGLLDQFSSIYGQENALVLSDFRTLQVSTVDMGKKFVFLICDTKASHSLVDSEYNERRVSCEAAASYYCTKVSRSGTPPTHLRDITWDEHEQLRSGLDDRIARRAAHIIGENRRVLAGKDLLTEGKIAEFGQLMYESHESSQHNFENSCPELDVAIQCAKGLGLPGGRLSGGGFGGSVVLLVEQSKALEIKHKMEFAYKEGTGKDCHIFTVVPSQGATIVRRN